MKQYIFVLGNAYSLAKLELLEYFKANNIEYKPIFENDPILILEFSDTINIGNLIFVLGGLVKIAELVCEIKEITSENVAKNIKHTKDRNLTLGISSYFDPNLQINNLLKEIKSLLKSEVKSFRYILPKDSTILSSIVVHKQKVSEYLIIFNKSKNSYFLGQTLIVQDFHDWSKRDYDRPCASPKSGMLPPKLARMMVNLANFNIRNNGKKVLLDPFCGMGTVLSEALMTGWDVIGSDLVKEVTVQAEKNLLWLKNKYPKILGNFKMYISDATHIDLNLIGQKVDAIVTEPFMGSPYEYMNGKLVQKSKPVTKEIIENNIKGLEKLYIGALRKWQEILKPSGIIVMVLPEIEFENKSFFVKKMVDSCENLGYTLKNGPLVYRRPQAIVRRQIFVFIKK